MFAVFIHLSATYSTMKTLVLGASANPSRYSNRAIRLLRVHNHQVLAVGREEGKVIDVVLQKSFPENEKVDTVVDGAARGRHRRRNLQRRKSPRSQCADCPRTRHAIKAALRRRRAGEAHSARQYVTHRDTGRLRQPGGIADGDRVSERLPCRIRRSRTGSFRQRKVNARISACVKVEIGLSRHQHHLRRLAGIRINVAINRVVTALIAEGVNKPLRQAIEHHAV